MTHFADTPITRISRLADVLNASGLSRSTLYLRVADGTFTSPVPLGSRLVGWPTAEVDAINKARIAGKSDNDIRALVATLQKARAC
jgi:prophage regulatory protein